MKSKNTTTRQTKTRRKVSETSSSTPDTPALSLGSISATVIKALGERPGVLLLLGLGLFSVASGIVSINVIGCCIDPNKPGTALLRACLCAIGISAVFLSLYELTRANLPLSKVRAWLFTGLWAICTSAIFANALRPLEAWTVDFQGYFASTNKYNVTLNRDVVRRYTGRSCALIVLRDVDGAPRHDDTEIVKSELFPIHAEDIKYSFDVDLGKMGDGLKLGEVVGCEVVILPNGFNLQTVHCLNDLYAQGAVHYDYYSYRVTVDKLNNRTVSLLARSDDPDNNISVLTRWLDALNRERLNRQAAR